MSWKLIQAFSIHNRMSCKFRLHVKYESVASRSEKWSQCGSILNLHSSAGPSGAPPLNAEKDQLYVNVKVTGQVKACVNFPQDLTIGFNWIDSATNGWQSWQRLQIFSMCRLRLLLHDYLVSRHLLCRQMLSPDFSIIEAHVRSLVFMKLITNALEGQQGHNT